MRINDENILREMRKNEDKNKRKNSYKVEMRLHNGNKEKLTFLQYYDHSCDIYNPFHINVYNNKGDYIHSGSGATIEDSYNNLITSLILYMNKAKEENHISNDKLTKILGICCPEINGESEND